MPKTSLQVWRFATFAVKISWDHFDGLCFAGKSLSGRPVQTLGCSRHYELMYNLGIQLLHCGQPTAALDCLLQTAGIFHLNPRLWLRLAECCIMTHRSVSKTQCVYRMSANKHTQLSCGRFLNFLLGGFVM